MAVPLTHGTTAVLYHEPEGLLLQASLADLPGDGALAGIAIQLGYQGAGEITVDIGVGPDTECAAAVDVWQEVRLHGGAGARTTLLQVPTTGPVHLRYTVLGQPGVDDPLRGRLDCLLTGTVPHLSATTVMGVSIESLTAPQQYAPQQ